MDIEELIAREAIRCTIASYTMAGDRLRVDEFAALFTEDAVLESDGVGEADAFRHNGKAEIRDWMARWRDRPESGSAARQASFVRHHLSTSQIELTAPDAAKARTYWAAYTDIGPDHAGYYLDVFARDGGRWLIAHRRVRLDWRSPDSLFTTAIARTR